MTVIISQSPFPVQGFEQRFYHGNRYHCISAKATFEWDDKAQLTALRHQPQMQLHDIWSGEENRSSLLYPSDLAPFKPTTDVMIIGTVRSPQKKPLPMWPVILRIGQREKRLRICGPRYWRHSLLSGWTLSEPEPTDSVSLLYENAYGGTTGPAREHYDEGEYYPPNPAGCGYIGKSRADTGQQYRAAQIEAWDAPVKEFGRNIAPGGFGPLPPFVPDRLRYAGTYDKQWEKEVSPNIPLDMDMRYWLSAPADQQPEDYLKAGDRIELAGVIPDRALSLQLPPLDAATVSELKSGRRHSQRMELDTVHIDLDKRRVTLRYHRIVAFDEDIVKINVYCAPTTLPGKEAKHG